MVIKRLYRYIFIFFTLWLSLSLIQGSRSFMPFKSLYPYFSWRLFDSFPPQNTDFAIELISSEGHTFPQPLDFIQDEVPRNEKLKKSYSLPYRTIQRFGQARLGQDPESFQLIKKTFEINFLSRYNSGEYQLILRTWEPLEAIKTGRYLNFNVLEKYKFNNRK